MNNRIKSGLLNFHSNTALLERPIHVETTLSEELECKCIEASTIFSKDITITNYITHYDVTKSLTQSKECLLKLKQFRDELANSPTQEVLMNFFDLLD